MANRQQSAFGSELGFPGSSQLFERVWEEGRVQQKEERTLHGCQQK